MSQNSMEFNLSDTSQGTSISRELNGLMNDRLMTDRTIKAQQDKWSKMLNGSVGSDINGVLSGEVKIKLPLRIKIKYWFNNLLNNLSKII